MAASPTTQEFLGDETQILMGGNGKRPETKTHTVYLDREDFRLTVGLCNSPKQTTKVKNDKGEWMVYNPPAEATMVVTWPEFDPNVFIATRDILIAPSYFERLQFHYVRREMTLADAEALKYPDR